MSDVDLEPQRQERGPGADGELMDSARDSPIIECPACRRVVGELGDWEVIPGFRLRVSSRMGLCPKHGEGGTTG